MVLNFENVTCKFGGLTAVNNVSFSVDSGQIVGLIGPNGSGKTTCFNLITGVHTPNSGEIYFEGKKITGLPSHTIAELGIARTFQINSVFPALTVLENVMTAHHARLKSGLVTGILGIPKVSRQEKHALEESRRLLEFVGLKHLINSRASLLTSADQRRLMVAIALATQPKLLLLDEPCAGMNHEEQADLIDLIRKVRDDGVPVLLVEHHMRMIMKVCDKVVVLNLGKKIADGLPTEVQRNEEVINAYLGRSGVADAESK